jgi:hypothetical protein
VTDREKWKDIASTGQSPQRAVVSMEEEEDCYTPDPTQLSAQSRAQTSKGTSLE